MFEDENHEANRGWSMDGHIWVETVGLTAQDAFGSNWTLTQEAQAGAAEPQMEDDLDGRPIGAPVPFGAGSNDPAVYEAALNRGASNPATYEAAPSRAAIAELICSPAYDWPCKEALRVSYCESRWDSGAYSSGNYGIFQINAIHRGRLQSVSGGEGDDLARLFDPHINTQVAYSIWREQGWRPWACRP